ncbi:MAG TPA: helix-turn-helix domain-containing protein [Solirubrobacterales bacterium]|nr:helix-turn-helix domain-containing protein [Solirubrobacterales bacterium]
MVQLLDCDGDLAAGLDSAEREIASQALPVQQVSLKKGAWRPDEEGPRPGHLGYLIVAGLVIRRVEVANGSKVELLGRGDLLRPWQEDVSSFCCSSWEVLQSSQVVSLDHRLTESLARWPVIVANVVARGVQRSRALAADGAIASIVGLEDRLLLLLWQLAERWGEARRDGVHLGIRLPHRLLAELSGARRPSVTSALAQLEEGGRLDSTPQGHWLLLGGPPQ